MAKEFIVSGDSHVVEPVDLCKTRLPKNMRDQALWEEDTILDEPLVPGGAHARIYNDWLAETYLPHSNRPRPAAAIPTTNAADAAKEIERAVRLGLTTLILPEIPQPFPYWAPEYEPIWEAAVANGLPIFIRTMPRIRCTVLCTGWRTRRCRAGRQLAAFPASPAR